MSSEEHMDRNLALEAVRITEAAALAASQYMGRGDDILAEQAAITAMRRALNGLDIAGTVVIGDGVDGEDCAIPPGAKVGSGEGPAIDVAVNPLEGATITALGGPNAISVLAMGSRKGLLPVPPIYMQKIAVGAGLPADVVSLDASPAENLRALGRAKGTDVADLTVCVLDRPRHSRLVDEIREAGARVMLIQHGDVSGVVATADPMSGVDIYLGVGGACEGIISAAALRCCGGQMQARLVPTSGEERSQVMELGLKEPDQLLTLDDMAAGEVMFAATGVTPGSLLRGVRRFGDGAITHSLVMRSLTGTVRRIEAHHRFGRSDGQQREHGKGDD